MTLLRKFTRRLTSIPLFSDTVREQFVERTRQQHSGWDFNMPTIERTFKATNSSCAVLIPLINIRCQPCMLFTQRALLLRNYRGAVCFPGGKLKPDENPEQVTIKLSLEGSS